MHSIDLPSEIVERVVSRRGKLHPFESLDPKTTALVVVDMQNAFGRPGSVLEIPYARGIVPNINTLAARVRDAGGVVVWVQMSIPSADQWPIFLGDMVPYPVADQMLGELLPGSEGHKLLPELDVSPDDVISPKDRFSAFLPSASNLSAELRERGVDTVIIAGTLTNVCCESSARDAAMQNYKVVMVSDANACRSDAEHTATLSAIIQFFGDVRTTGEVLEMLSA